MPATRNEVEEVVSQWLGYARRMAVPFPKAEQADLGGVAVCWLNLQWPVMNLCLVHTTVRDEADLDRRIDAAVRFAGCRKCAYATCDELMPERVRDNAREILAAHRLEQVNTGPGMIADAIVPPSRVLPELEYRPFTDIDARRDMADLNALVYGIPNEWTREVLLPEGGFDENVLGCIAYDREKPVSCALICLVANRLHVGWVATDPAHRNRGYGEAVTREALQRASEATGLTRSALRSTAAGYPLYRRMGYRPVVTFRYWARSAPHADSPSGE